MREARSKLRLIKPEDMDMDEYLVLSVIFMYFMYYELISPMILWYQIH